MPQAPQPCSATWLVLCKLTSVTRHSRHTARLGCPWLRHATRQSGQNLIFSVLSFCSEKLLSEFMCLWGCVYFFKLLRLNDLPGLKVHLRGGAWSTSVECRSLSTTILLRSTSKLRLAYITFTYIWYTSHVKQIFVSICERRRRQWIGTNKQRKNLSMVYLTVLPMIVSVQTFQYPLDTIPDSYPVASPVRAVVYE